MPVRDLWYKHVTTIDEKTGKKKTQKIPTSRHGVGKRWIVQYLDLDGHRTSETFEVREDADEFDARVRVGKADGTLIAADKKDVTLGDLWGPWLDTKAGISEKSRKDYVSYWHTHIEPTWGARKVRDIQEHQVVAWIAGLTTTKGVKEGDDPRPLGGSAKRKIDGMMKSMLTRAVKLKVIPANPMAGVTVPAIPKAERRYLKIEEVDALLFAAKKPAVKLMLEVLLRTALRPGEAKGLKVKDLDVERRRLMIRRDVDDLGRVDETKTRMHRDVPLSQVILLALEEAAEARTAKHGSCLTSTATSGPLRAGASSGKTFSSTQASTPPSRPTSSSTPPFPWPSPPARTSTWFSACAATPPPPRHCSSTDTSGMKAWTRPPKPSSAT